MNQSLEMSRATTRQHADRVQPARVGVRLSEGDEGPWRVACSLVLIAFGITFGVALARLHYSLGGEASAQGLSQGFVLELYESFGFASSFYFFLLVTIWGLISFFGASVRASLRRLAVAVVFVASFASLSALMGGDGGSFGAWVAERLQSGIGSAVTFLILGLMSVTSLLLATDWFFFTRFRALLAPRDATRARDTEAPAASEVFRPEEITGQPLRPVPIPVSPGAKGYEKAKTEVETARLREQALVDRVLEEARLELSGNAELASTPASAVLAPPQEADEDVVAAEVEEDEVVDVEARRLALRARREAARIAREEASLFGHDDREDTESIETEIETPDETPDVEPEVPATAEASTDDIHTDGLHPDEELGLAGLLGGEEPFAALDNDDLLAKAGEAMEKQWQSGSIGFSKDLGERDGTTDAAAERATDVPDERGEERVAPAIERDPFCAEPDRTQRTVDPEPLESSRVPTAASGGGGEEDEAETPIVIEPVPSRRPMPEEAPDDAPVPAETGGSGDAADAPPQQQVLFDLGQVEEPEIETRLEEAAELVLNARRPTPSLLQRRLGVDGVVARRLLDRLAVLGAVAEPSDGGAWVPLQSFEDWMARAR